MSSPNGTPDVTAKRRKVSTTESTSSVASSSNKEKEEPQPQVSPSPSRASRRIAGKERSYSHKFGYGEDEAILLLDDEKRKSSPRKSISNEVKDDAKAETKRKPPKRSNANDGPQTTPPSANRSNKTNSAKVKNNRSKSVEEKSDDDQVGIHALVTTDNKTDGEVVSNTVNVKEQTQPREDKMPMLEAEEHETVHETKEELGTSNMVKASSSREDVNDNVEDKKTSSTLPKTDVSLKRKNANRAAKASDTPNPPVRRTRQTVNEESLRVQADVSVDSATAKSPALGNDTSFKASLPAKKRPLEAKHRNTETHTPLPQNSNALTSPVNSSSASTKQYPNATEELIQELKSNKQEQSLTIDEFRRNRDEQQKVIDDLRKHRELQEKLIEDLRQSRNEKQVEVEKLRAQQRASSILFHRERDAPLSRYDDLSDHGSSDNEDFGSVENVSTKEFKFSSKSPLTFDGVVENIMGFTSSADLINCRLVNKQWDKLASNSFKKTGTVALRYGVSDFMNVVQTSSSLFPMSSFNIFLTDSFVKDANTEVFTRRYSNYILKLKLTLEYFYTESIPVHHLKQFLPPGFPNLEHLILKLPCKYLSMPANPRPEEDYGLFLNNTPTKLKVLKVVCQCTPIPHEEPEIADNHFQRGLLVELLENSPNLTNFEFKSGRFDTNRTMLRRVVDLLNRVNLPKLQHLSLRGLEFQDLEAPGFLPNYNLKSLYLNALPWERVEAIWIQHKSTLEAVAIGKVIRNLDLNSTALANYVFSSLKELVIHPKIEDPSILSSFSRLFPCLRKLELQNPNETTVLNIWKDLTQLHELILNYSNDGGDNEKYKILHLDSLLSGFSVNNCELILKKIMKKGLPQNLDFGAAERFGQGHSIQSMTNLQKLAITSSSKSIPFRITEVGLVLVLLRMKTLTSITINPCVLMKDTMRQLVGRISPAIYLSITCPEKEEDYESAKIALL